MRAATSGATRSGAIGAASTPRPMPPTSPASRSPTAAPLASAATGRARARRAASCARPTPAPAPTSAPRSAPSTTPPTAITSTSTAAPSRAAGELLGARWILDVLDLVEFDGASVPTGFLDAANVDGLADVARLRVDRNGATRALPFHSLGSGNVALAVGLAAGLLERLVDQVDAVPAADRVDVGAAPAVV